MKTTKEIEEAYEIAKNARTEVKAELIRLIIEDDFSQANDQMYNLLIVDTAVKTIEQCYYE